MQVAKEAVTFLGMGILPREDNSRNADIFAFHFPTALFFVDGFCIQLAANMPATGAGHTTFIASTEAVAGRRDAEYHREVNEGR